MGKIVKAIASVGLIVAGAVTGNFALIAAGVSLGGSVLAKKPKSPANSQENIDRLRANIDPRTPRKTVIGSTAMATDIRDEEFTDDQEYFHRFIVVASHKVEAINEIWFDDKVAWTSAGGVQGEYDGYLTVATVLEGSAANAINISARMGSTRRYTGLAYVHLRYKLTGNSKKAESPFAQSITTRITIRGDGAALPDPRDVAQDMADQSTWVWDSDACRNPALALLFYLLGYKINGLLAIGKGIPPARIDLASFAVAANICDELVDDGAGGTEPRYRCDGVWSEGDSPTTVIDMLKATMNADLDDVGGKLRLTVFHNDLATPDADFDDSDIIDAFDWQPLPSLDSTFNVVRGTFTDPSDESLYQQIDYPQVETTSPDGIDRINTFNLPMVESPTQAQRLVTLRLNRQKYAGVFSAEFQATGWKVQKNSVARLTFAQTGFVQKLFRVVDMEIRRDGVVPMTLREENAAIYANPTFGDVISPVASTPWDYTKSPIYTGINQGITFIPAVAPFNIQADTSGITSTALPQTRSIKLFSGDTDVTANAVWGISNTGAGLSATIGASTGVLSLDTADSFGVIGVEAVYLGLTYSAVVVVNRTQANVTTGGVSGSTTFTDAEWINITTTSDVQVTDFGVIVQSDASGELRYSGASAYYGSGTAIIKAQYSATSETGPWTDFAAEVTGSVASGEEPGFVALTTATQTGLTATTDYYVRLIARRSAGTGELSWTSPNFTVRQP